MLQDDVIGSYFANIGFQHSDNYCHFPSFMASPFSGVEFHKTLCGVTSQLTVTSSVVVCFAVGYLEQVTSLRFTARNSRTLPTEITLQRFLQVNPLRDVMSSQLKSV